MNLVTYLDIGFFHHFSFLPSLGKNKTTATKQPQLILMGRGGGGEGGS